MKFITSKILFITLLYLLINPLSARINLYKNDKDVKHSLFREKDSLERMSFDSEGVPPPKEKKYIITQKKIGKTIKKSKTLKRK